MCIIVFFKTNTNNNIEIKKSTNSIAMCKFSIDEPSVSETSRCRYETLGAKVDSLIFCLMKLSKFH